MKQALIWAAALSSVMAAGAWAQTTAPNTAMPSAPPAVSKAAAVQTPSGASAATVHAVCKDGTAFQGASLNGACRGHGGVDKHAAAAAATAAPPAAAMAGTPSGNVKPAAPAAARAPAAGGGPGKVWANDSTKVYHCAGDKYYGATKHGAYMSEADAKAKGFHGDHGKVCS
jgi:hypothetical protein